MVTSSRLPVLWLCGAPATGKSTVAWQVFSDLADQGFCVGYLDIDQIGMLAPPPDADSRCHRFKVDNLAAMVRNYRTAGTQVLVISGVIDPEHGHDFAEAASDADITFCHLTVDEPTLRERLAARGWPCEAADEAVIMMSDLADAPFVTTVIDTTGRDAVGVARDAATLGDSRFQHPRHAGAAGVLCRRRDDNHRSTCRGEVVGLVGHGHAPVGQR